MAKQKMVLKVSMEDSKKRSKALKIAVGLAGVNSAEIEESQVVVIGEGVGSVKLTTMLRRKMGFVELVSVSTVEEKKKEEAAKDVQPVVWPFHFSMAPQPYMYVEARNPSYDSCCMM